MRTLAGIIALVAATMTIACGSGGGATSTATPRAASPTTAATAAASPTSALSASPQPTLAPPTAPPAAASTPVPTQPTKAVPPPAPRPTQPAPPPPPPPSGVTLSIGANNLEFSPTSLSAPAGATVTIAFNNAESGVPHNIDVFSPSGASIGKTDVITGPAQATLSLGALSAGRYSFKCDVHPFMHGTIAVQ